MKTFYTLAYKEVDSKGREKNQKYVGVYKTIYELEEAKTNLLSMVNQNLSFQVYTHEQVFYK